MPAIQIKESPVYTFFSSSDRGAACKFLVEQLVSLDPWLSIDSVLTDTITSYSALIRVANSNVGFNIMSSGGSIQVNRVVWKADGSYSATVSATVPDFFKTSDSGAKVKVSTVGVDNVLKSAMFTSDQVYYSLDLSYGMFTSDLYKNPVYIFDAFSAYGSVWPTAAKSNLVYAAPKYWYNPDLDIEERVYFVDLQSVDPWTKSGYLYSLLPKGFLGYSQTKGFGNIKWGGAYDLYLLIDFTGTPVTTLFGETVTINGVSTLSGGYVAMIV